MTAKQRKCRRIACPQIETADGQVLPLQAVEILEGRVVSYYPLREEIPFTEWIGQRVVLRRDENETLCAYCEEKIIE